MKLLLVFALCGVTCCLAGPTCSKDEISKCSQGPPIAGETEEEKMDKECRHTACWIEIYERCGNAAFGKMPFPIKAYKKSQEVCDKSSALYRKSLENADCLRRVTKLEDLKRLSDMCGLDQIFSDRHCRIIPKAFACCLNYIIRECGEDAGDVFRVGALPAFDPYDCMSTFEE